jgi:hypothetical protein
MPAIHPARLERQSKELAALFHKPSAFALEWRHLLEYYAQRTHRFGDKKEKPTAIRRYRIAPPIFQAVLVELEPFLDRFPDDAVALLNALWEQPILESRLLAARALGFLPVDRPQLVTTFAVEWGRLVRDDVVREAIVGPGLRRLRREAPLELIGLLEYWFSGGDSTNHIMGYAAVIYLLEETSFQDLPALFNLLERVMPAITNSLRPYALDALRAFIARSPRETALFFERLLEEADAPPVLWLARRSLESFPADLQGRLRAKIRSIPRS